MSLAAFFLPPLNFKCYTTHLVFTAQQATVILCKQCLPGVLQELKLQCPEGNLHLLELLLNKLLVTSSVVPPQPKYVGALAQTYPLTGWPCPQQG